MTDFGISSTKLLPNRNIMPQASRMSADVLPFETPQGLRSNDASSQPLRIMLASTERGWHGGEEQARQLVEGLRARGHDCRIIALESGDFPRYQAAFVILTLNTF